MLVIIEEESKEEVKGLIRDGGVHNTSANEVSIEKILSLVRSVRVFKKRASMNKNQEMQNMLTARVNYRLLIHICYA